MAGKHTSGPWVVAGERVFHGNNHLATAWSPRSVSDEREDGESWLDMRNRTQPERDAVAAENLANARLMAAAPDLLDVLLSIQADQSWRTNDNSLWPRINEVVRRATQPLPPPNEDQP